MNGVFDDFHPDWGRERRIGVDETVKGAGEMDQVSVVRIKRVEVAIAKHVAILDKKGKEEPVKRSWESRKNGC